jgi:L-ascorbate metabolism protein UlaG (beta-lactamase superfamily)
MIVTWHGAGAIRIQQGDLVVALGPVSKRSKLKPSNFGADVALVPVRHEDADGEDAVSRGDARPFVARTPGEYETSGLFVRGFATRTTYSGGPGPNTCFSFQIDDCNVLYMGATEEDDIPAEAKEELPETDMIFVPIGGEGTLDPAKAYKLAVRREPKVIVPIFHDGGDALKRFLREAGADKVETVDKFTVRRRDLEKMAGQVVVLAAA